MKKMTPKDVRFWTVSAEFVGIAVCFIGALMEIMLIVGVGFVIVVGGLVFFFLYYRCPHCGKHLDRSDGDYCPYCGKELQEE